MLGKNLGNLRLMISGKLEFRLICLSSLRQIEINLVLDL